MQGQNPVYIISFGGREPSSGHEKEGMPRIMFAAPGSGSGKDIADLRLPAGGKTERASSMFV